MARLLRFQSCVVVLSLFFVTSLTYGEEKEGGWSDFEQTKAVDNDDIEAKVDEPVKVAQGSGGKGVVWGKSGKGKETEEKKTAPEKADVPQKTTVKRPVVEAKVTAKAETAKPAPTAEDGEKYLLRSNRKKGSTDLVETLLEVTGDVKQVTEDLKAVKDKMEVVAGFRYEERVERVSPSDGPLSSIRLYNLAKAKMKIGDTVKTPELDEKLQTIVCTLDKDKVSLFSPKGALRGEQLLLIEDLPGNTLTLDRLLPDKEVAIGENWKISDAVLRSFLSIDAVTENNVEAVLTAVADNMAMVEVVGDVGGVYLGASTEMSVRAKFQFDLSTKRINWLGLLIEEDRSIGHVGPGFDLVARLQVKISPVETPQSLTDDLIMSLDVKQNEKLLKLKYDGGKGPWRFSHHRDWYVFQDDPQTTILRKLHQGELVAQCNIADMGTVDVKTMTTLDKFKKELQTGLGDSFGKVVSAGEHTDDAGYKVYTVLIDGVVEDLPLRWIYNLLTDSEGRQAVVVFVVEAKMLEQFDDADEILLGTFRLGK